ncbi:MAG TPA: ABC transporter family substrate-binding protein [Trebonia sp.]|jgi:peptide/nickel transport system substrate-binding protein|nr:ABC transporter family substrate-binding protein [Trebonia sp.]
MIRLTTGRRLAALVFAAACAIGVAACSSSGGTATPTASSTNAAVSVKTGGTITYALDEDLDGFNINYANDDEEVLEEVTDNIWPQIFVPTPSLKLALDTNVVTSATVTSTSPQTVVYQINPKATWSDGVPISAADFIYNWQAQSGDPKYKDKGGAAFLPTSTAGYNQIKSVTGSNGGKTVTVVFSSPFGDWQSLFNNLLPAHIAEKYGFNSGFQSFGPAVKVSGGPYVIQSYTQGEDLVEVPNPKWWGTKPKLSKIVFRFILDDNQIPAAIQNGEVQLAEPSLASLSFKDAVAGISGTTTQVLAGLEFQHIDFNQANPYLALSDVRHAIADGTNRQEMVQRIVSPLTTSIKPLENRIWMPIQPQYQNTSGSNGDFSVAEAKKLLAASGFTMGSDGYFHPNFGPEKGQDFTLSISTTSGIEVRSQIEQLFQADMKAIGVKITIQNYSANTLFGTVGPKGEFDLIEFAWVQSPYASGSESIYCSYTDASVCGENWDHYSDPQVDKLYDQALATINSAKAASLYNQVDALLWKDMATLPLFEQPDLYTWSTSYGNIEPDPANINIPWNAYDWGLKA